eukprot:COSAG06_NODE_40460_length_401_cov_39.261589_1_plen_84_part_00
MGDGNTQFFAKRDKDGLTINAWSTRFTKVVTQDTMAVLEYAEEAAQGADQQGLVHIYREMLRGIHLDLFPQCMRDSAVKRIRP